MMNSISLCLFFLLTWSVAGAVKVYCPLECACSFDESPQIEEIREESFKVSCVGLDLTALPHEFDDQQVLKLFNFSRNSLTALDDETFNSNLKFADLVWLDLRNNQIGNITDDAFRSLDKLRMLILTGNRLEYIPNLAWTANLTYLKLNFNNISTVPTGAFSALQQLKSLLLDYNQITSIEANAFACLFSLERLDLSHNQLVRMPINVFKEMAQQKSSPLVDFTGNDWACECFMKWPKQLALSSNLIPNCTYGNDSFSWTSESVEGLFDFSCFCPDCEVDKATVDCSDLSIHHLNENTDFETDSVADGFPNLYVTTSFIVSDFIIVLVVFVVVLLAIVVFVVVRRRRRNVYVVNEKRRVASSVVDNEKDVKV